MKWDELGELERRWCYECYCADVWYEDGDKAKPMTYEEWCVESEKFGEAYGICI